MIVVTLQVEPGEYEIGRIEIENVQVNEDGTADYAIRFGVEKIAGVGMHTRAIFGFPREKYNVLALLRQALETLEPEDLELNGSWENRRTTTGIHRLLPWKRS